MPSPIVFTDGRLFDAPKNLAPPRRTPMRSKLLALAAALTTLALPPGAFADQPGGAAAAAGSEGRKFALLVGVTNYQGTDLADLKFPEKDVTDLADVLRAQSYRRVVLMTRTEGFAKR